MALHPHHSFFFCNFIIIIYIYNIILTYIYISIYNISHHNTEANSLLECINKLDKNEAVHFVRRFGHSYPSVQAKIYILGNVNRRQLQYEYYMNALENAKRIVNDDYLKMLLTARAYIGLGRIATGEIRDEQRVAYLKHAIN